MEQRQRRRRRRRAADRQSEWLQGSRRASTPASDSKQIGQSFIASREMSPTCSELIAAGESIQLDTGEAHAAAAGAGSAPPAADAI